MKFALIKGKRVRLNSIKKYEPTVSNTKNPVFGVKIYYSLSARPLADHFTFEDEDERDDCLVKLDDLLEVK